MYKSMITRRNLDMKISAFITIIYHDDKVSKFFAFLIELKKNKKTEWYELFSICGIEFFI